MTGRTLPLAGASKLQIEMAFFKAIIEDGDVESVRAMLDNDLVDPNLRSTRAHVESLQPNEQIQGLFWEVPEGWAALHYAAHLGLVEIVDAVLSHPKALVNIRNDDDRTSICLAYNAKQDLVIRRILQDDNLDMSKAETHCSGGLGMSALMIVIAEMGGSAKPEYLDWLLAHRSTRLNYRDTEGDCALFYAIETGSAEVVTKLLAHKDININMKNNAGETPFWRAVDHQNIDLLKIFLNDPRCDICVRSKYDQSIIDSCFGNPRNDYVVDPKVIKTILDSLSNRLQAKINLAKRKTDLIQKASGFAEDANEAVLGGFLRPPKCDIVGENTLLNIEDRICRSHDGQNIKRLEEILTLVKDFCSKFQ